MRPDGPQDRREAPAVRALEEHGFNSWPAFDTLVAEGWLFRFAAGHTRRANSVNAYDPVPGGFEGIVGLAERLYAADGLAPTFRITPLAPPEADRFLDERGWTRRGESLVLAGPIAPEMAAPAGVALDPRPSVAIESRPSEANVGNLAPPMGVVIEPRPSEAWIAQVAGAHTLPDREVATMTRILGAIRPDAAYATVFDEGPAAFGLAVVERGIVGFHRIVTLPGQRGRGAARRVMQALLAWGRARGAVWATIQVEADNAPARGLYESLGLSERYRYHYRVKP